MSEQQSSLAGSLEDVPVVDLLQFLHASGRTGTLEVRRRVEGGEEDVFYVVLHNGRILHASTPARINLGRLLKEGGVVTEEQIQEALGDKHPGELLGQILVRRGVVTSAQLAAAVKRQIELTLGEIVGWTRGQFAFYLEDHVPADDIRVSLKELLPISDVNTQFLLLEALRMFDEKRSGQVAPPAAPEGNEDFDFPEPSIQPAPAAHKPHLCVASTSRPLVARFAALAQSRGWTLETPATLKALEDWSPAGRPGRAVLVIDAPALAWNETTTRGLPGTVAHLLATHPGISVVVLGSDLAPEAVAELYASGVEAVLPRPPLDGLESSAPVPQAARGALRAVTVVLERILGTPARPAPTGSAAELVLLERARIQVDKVQRSARDLSVGLTFLEAVAEHFDRAILMLRVGDALTVIGAFGLGADGRSLSQSVPSGTRLEVGAGGKLATVLAEPTSVCMETTSIDFPPVVADQLSRPNGGLGCLLPLVGAEAAVGLVYCDLGPNPDIPENVIEALQIVSKCAGLAMELAITRTRLHRLEQSKK